MRRPYKEYTYREIKEFANEKSNSITQKAISKFLEDDLTNKRKVGNIIVYQLNLRNNTVFAYFDILLRERLSNPVKISLEKIKEELENIEFVSIVIFGSYAEGNQTPKSDLDIAFFVPSEEDKRICKLSLKSAELKTILQVDHHVFTKDEMLQMLKDNHENLGKQIAKKHLPIHNPAIFYAIIQGGINNGFKPVYQ